MRAVNASGFGLAIAVSLVVSCAGGDGGSTIGSQLRLEAGGPNTKIVVCAEGETVYGIDVSYYQGTIDWDAMADAGVEFAFIRVSDGLGYPDSQFQANWQGAANAGIIRGVYQFFRQDEDPVAQANYLLTEMGDLAPGDLPPVIDVESTDGQTPTTMMNNIQAWLDQVEGATGRTPIIYTGMYFWQDNVGSDDFSTYPLWAPNYGPDCPNIANSWTDWVFWQFSATGSVAGIAGDVDENWFNGSYADLLDFVEGASSCEEIPPEGRIVDEADECFFAGGDAQWWRYEDDGYDDNLMWTNATSNTDVDNYGVWNLDFEEAGSYLVEVYTDGSWAESTMCGYQVRHDGVEETALVDQTADDGWRELGEFDFAQGDDQWIRLDDNTGEDVSLELAIVYDAVRLTGDGGGDGDTDVDSDSDTDGEGDENCWSITQPDSGGCSFTGTAPAVDGGLWLVFLSLC